MVASTSLSQWRFVYCGHAVVSGLCPHRCLVERRFDDLAFAATFDQPQSRDDGAVERQASGVVSLCRARHGDIAIFALAHSVVEARTAKERGDVVARAPGFGACRAVTRERCMHESRVQTQKGCRVHVEPFLSFDQQIAQEDIGIGHQPVQDRCAVFVADVDRHGLLATVVYVELKVIGLEFVGELGRALHAAHRVTGERFHLDDGGAHIGQDGAT